MKFKLLGLRIKSPGPGTFRSRALLSFLILFQSMGFNRLCAAPVPPVDAATLKNVSYENKQLLIHLDKAAPYRIFSLPRPPRLVVELSGTIHGNKVYEENVKDGILNKIRSAQFKSSPENVTRIVLEMSRMSSYRSSQNGQDILVDFAGAGFNSPKAGSSDFAKSPSSSPVAKPIGADLSFPVENESVSGQASETLISAGAESASFKVKRKPGRNLLASLPKNPVTIDFDDADIRDVIRVLSEMSGVNIIQTSDVRGFVSIHLDQVPFNQAFDTVLSMQGLVAQQMGDNILRILTPEALSADRARSVVIYKTYTLNYAKASDITQHLGAVRISPNSKVTVDEKTNSIILTDTPEGLAAAERLILELDKKPQQVMIEAKIVDITIDNQLDLGVQWEFVSTKEFDSGARKSMIGQLASEETDLIKAGTVGFPLNTDPQFIRNAFPPASRGTGVNLPGLSDTAFTFGLIQNANLFSATLNALITNGKGKLLSNPKIITLNNQQARIQSGSKIPYNSVTVTPTGSTQSSSFVDVGIILIVTPIINADNKIRLKIKPEVSRIPATANANTAPPVETRNAETEVIIRDGETLVIGGMIREDDNEANKKVPLLGDIPVLGVFFRSKKDQKTRQELLIFVTPRIIRD